MLGGLFNVYGEVKSIFVCLDFTENFVRGHLGDILKLKQIYLITVYHAVGSIA